MGESAINLNTTTFDEWVVARDELLQKEKELTKLRDELAKERQALPVVPIEKDYRFLTESGDQGLADLFGDHSQLLVYHFMYGEGWTMTCDGCTAWANALNGTTTSFSGADAKLVVCSNAPLDQLLEEKQRRGWDFEWVSDYGSDFGVDFYSSAENPEVKSKSVGQQTVYFDRGENHAISAFYKDETGRVYLTYSCFNRGVEPMNGAFAYYDVLKKGRQW